MLRSHVSIRVLTTGLQKHFGLLKTVQHVFTLSRLLYCPKNMSTNSSNHRKRSRWGDRDRHSHSNGNRAPTNSTASANMNNDVSDQEALEALLSSAKAKEEEHKPHAQQQKIGQRDNKKPRRDDYHDSRRGGRGGHGTTHRGGNYGGRGGRTGSDRNNGPDYSYYGNNNEREGDDKKLDNESQDNSAELKEKEKPNFGLSGALAEEEVGELKFREPPEARAPNTQWRLYVFKNDEALETLHISKQSAYLFGRNKELADIALLHPSASGQHSVLQYRAMSGKEDGRLRCKPYLLDLESTNGSFINGIQIDPARYYELKKGDVLKFGASTREYVLLTENTTSIK